MREYADLHIHTTTSDGLHTPSDVVAMACKIGLRVIAITDHDAVEGVAEARAAAAGTGLQVIAGVEISASIDETECHVLGYFVDDDDAVLREQLARFRTARVDRVERMLGRLSELGMTLGFDHVQEIAGDGSIGRPHIARAMVEAGYVQDPKQAFERYLSRGRPAYVPRLKVTPVQALQMIRAAGGLPVLAHPWELQAIVPSLVPAGLVGLEAYYAGYNAAGTALLVQLAERHGLLCTGGSDFHGLALSPANALGACHLPASAVEALLARHAALTLR
ncbi:MAG: PHP domain-containing protein [Chloroflexi bacterium]|nr:PHP domain-containing protein [Chloroflexota bacterium]